MARPTLAVWKFASCDGCQLTLLDLEDELLAIADALDIAYFLEASSRVGPGPYDLSLVEGSITTPHDVARIHEVRERSKVLVTFGACATAGGIQALRNFRDHAEMMAQVYAKPEYIETLATSTAIEKHVKVDFELRGCPPDKRQLYEVIAAFLKGRRPSIPTYSVCVECKMRGNVCVLVAHGTPCLGPVTHAGCGALCPTYQRWCYGCFGPSDAPHFPPLERQLVANGTPLVEVERLLSNVNVADFDEERRKRGR
jgi:coenzyme F420-reducing hydrogenase gamma subunit